MFKFSQRSEKHLQGVHGDLVKVVRKALEYSTVDFAVIEGVRTKARQAQLFKQGATKTMNSRHLTGHAVDLPPLVEGKSLGQNGINLRKLRRQCFERPKN